MSIDPRAAVLARQLGQLLRHYVPDATEGHAMLELAHWFQAGLADEPNGRHARLQLPCHPETAEEPAPSRMFDLTGTYLMQIDFDPLCAVIEAIPQDKDPASYTGPSVALKFERANPGALADITVAAFDGAGQHRGQIIARD